MKKIEDYDLSSFDLFDKFERNLQLPTDYMWPGETEKKLQEVIEKWKEIDDSEYSQDKLFAKFFHASFSTKKIGNKLFAEVLKFPKTDRHCAFVWDRLVYMIPEESSYKYISKLSEIKDNFQYKEFKKSVVNSSLNHNQQGFIILMNLLDKNVLSFKNITKVLDTSLIHYIPQINLPEKYSINILNTLSHTINKIDNLTVQKVSIKNNEILCEFLHNCIDKYKNSDLYTHLIDAFDALSPETQELFKNNGIYPKVLNEKLNLSLTDTMKISKLRKI